ncbi:hypothetical protein MENTO_v1c00630 [Mesoplasma entomophilum]|uniref:Uncharacterized protein n=1 Tax=Mesoplasma entomophilum TaxID=2149 RepID=A0A3S5XY89_9MOLU|nr:hypothetical protein [Mesoplasma entomophilum]ATQ35224.1 hypothetical protein CS528_00315 [Mesoplasma entomophilum]ATZ19172.1 hypothetical protein MENTO_v1c00630 [Mesoplasma entomophilum]
MNKESFFLKNIKRIYIIFWFVFALHAIIFLVLLSIVIVSFYLEKIDIVAFYILILEISYIWLFLLLIGIYSFCKRLDVNDHILNKEFMVLVLNKKIWKQNYMDSAKPRQWLIFNFFTFIFPVASIVATLGTGFQLSIDLMLSIIFILPFLVFYLSMKIGFLIFGTSIRKNASQTILNDDLKTLI